MTVLKGYNGGSWQPVAIGAQGLTGTQGLTGPQGIQGTAASGGGSMTLISTTSLSGSSVTASGLTGYNQYYYEVRDARWDSSNSVPQIYTSNFGTDGSMSGTVASVNYQAQSLTRWYLTGSSNADRSNSFYASGTIYIFTDGKQMLRSIASYYDGSKYQTANLGGANYGGGVSSITFTTSGGYTFNNGDLYIYGVK